MPYFNTCDICGAHLDPGENCDCKKEKRSPATTQNDLKKEAINAALFFSISHKKRKIKTKK